MDWCLCLAHGRPTAAYCVVSLSADMDLTVSQTDFGFKMTLESLLGGTLKEEPEAYRDASPLS